MKSSIDLVLDIETTGLTAGCCVLSIGAYSTDMEHQFYMPISYHNQKEILGLRDDPSTMKFWSIQSAEARKEAFSGTLDAITVLGAFLDFIQHLPSKQVFFWGNGADFDQPILAKLFEVVGMKNPFGFNNRCYRTLKNLYKNIPASKNFEGMKHHALWDAKHEAKHLSQLLQYHYTRLNAEVKTQLPLFQD